VEGNLAAQVAPISAAADVIGEADEAMRLGRRIKVGFVLFSIGLLAALSGMIYLLVSQIFTSITPELRHDLQWKTALETTIVMAGVEAIRHATNRSTYATVSVALMLRS